MQDHIIHQFSNYEYTIAKLLIVKDVSNLSEILK